MARVHLIMRGEGLDARPVYTATLRQDAEELVEILNKGMDPEAFEDPLYISGTVYHDVSLPQLRAGYRFWSVALRGSLENTGVQVDQARKVSCPMEEQEFLIGDGHWSFHGCAWAKDVETAVNAVTARLRERRKCPDFGDKDLGKIEVS